MLWAFFSGGFMLALGIVVGFTMGQMKAENYKNDDDI